LLKQQTLEEAHTLFYLLNRARRRARARPRSLTVAGQRRFALR